MKIVVKTTKPEKQKGGCLLLGVYAGRLRSATEKELSPEVAAVLKRAAGRENFTGKIGQLLELTTPDGCRADRLLLIGLGEEKRGTGEILRRAVGTALQRMHKVHESDLAVVFDSFTLRKLDTAQRAEALVEGALLGDYRFDRYQTEDKETRNSKPIRVTLLTKTHDLQAVESGVSVAAAVCAGVVLARDLVNEPGNVKSPDYLANRAQQVCTEAGLECTILGRAELEKEQMGAMLGVAQGSSREPRLIVMQYHGGSAEQKPIALVGKGVVFDTGGISIKPSEGMEEMKMDMGGGAAVIGTMQAAARLKLPCNLVGVVPAVENMTSGTAIRPGDILTSQSGKTIEVVNTDAEGRLILADAISYVRRFEPIQVIDLATLTGACIIALGHHATAVLGNDEKLIASLIRAGEQSGERLWQLPLWEEYAEQIKSEVADVKNVGGRPAGTITAAAFIQKFADGLNWVHLDIAGTGWEEKGRPCYSFGGTGVGVRLLSCYLRGLHLS
ncbi:MAG: leucyl aminopeptidase [Desulfuromonadales bacterium]|nr:leucyl aminopeptidase [Desulfuromonadales bacterium]